MVYKILESFVGRVVEAEAIFSHLRSVCHAFRARTKAKGVL